ncbi:MAG TPA: hypothetical protein ENN77_01570 [Candidatus Wirthbacteria bacterium]|nr:hypothetical protein [Candidatus Wirthbacteria bacterium]
MHVVQYSGPFGFIKPWTAVRDSETFSQQFLTPSIIEGMEKKIFPELLDKHGYPGRIIRHRLSYCGLDSQQEQTQPKAWSSKNTGSIQDGTKATIFSRPRSILTRGTMIKPILYLGFEDREHAQKASTEHLCLCRNEDVILPDPTIIEVTEEDFDRTDPYRFNDTLYSFHGFELRFGENDRSFLVGYNRFRDPVEPMYGWLHIVGNPIRSEEE